VRVHQHGASTCLHGSYYIRVSHDRWALPFAVAACAAAALLHIIMSDPRLTAAVQKDWKDREMVELLHLNMLKVSYAIESIAQGIAERVLLIASRKHYATFDHQ
jgi:hypothetical protein